MNPRTILSTTAVRQVGVWFLIGSATLLLGCEYVRPTINAPLTRWDATYGYRSTNLRRTDDEVDHHLLAGSRLVRNSPEFQRLMRDLASDAAATPQSPVSIQAP